MSVEHVGPRLEGTVLPSGPGSIYANVQTHYSQSARSNDDDYGSAVASALGYSKEELDSIPADSNLGLSCGNPFVIAKLKDGETVIDLGSGAGFDVFQAAKKVGPSGSVIGVDANKVCIMSLRLLQLKLITITGYAFPSSKHQGENRCSQHYIRGIPHN